MCNKIRVTCTKHAIDRVLERQKKKDKDGAYYFLYGLFKELHNCYKNKKYHKDRRVNVFSKSHGRYLITDGSHKIIYAKGIGEFTIITYSKKTDQDKVIHSILNFNKNNKWA